LGRLTGKLWPKVVPQTPTVIWRTAVFAGTFMMELAGLEPAASWVRFGRPHCSNSADLQDIWLATARGRPFRITYICRRFSGVKARETALWPKRASHLDAVVLSDPLVAQSEVCAAEEVTFATAPFRAKQQSASGESGCCLAWKIRRRSPLRVGACAAIALRATRHLGHGPSARMSLIRSSASRSLAGLSLPAW
jgi:hypothetical protein